MFLLLAGEGAHHKPHKKWGKTRFLSTSPVIETHRLKHPVLVEYFRDVQEKAGFSDFDKGRRKKNTSLVAKKERGSLIFKAFFGY